MIAAIPICVYVYILNELSIILRVRVYYILIYLYIGGYIGLYIRIAVNRLISMRASAPLRLLAKLMGIVAGNTTS